MQIINHYIYEIKSEETRYLHDCDKCIFLGCSNEYDLYICIDQTSPKLTTIIGRYSDNGPDYYSSLPPGAMAYPKDYLLSAGEWYKTCLARALEKNLIRWQDIYNS